MRTIIKDYYELIRIDTFIGRYNYLRVNSPVGAENFGPNKYLYTDFLKSGEWKDLCDYVILRDKALDLAFPGRELKKELGQRIIVHHINPVTIEDLLNRTEFLLNPKYLVCSWDQTHQAIHYGNSDMLMLDPINRVPNDTCPWK